MRLIFMATGDIALPSFRYLLEHGPKPLALVTQPDKPVGRHQVLTPPAIKREAMEAGIPVFQPEKVGDAVDAMEELRPEVIVVMAYGQILRKNVLNLPSRAIINLHASVLPRHRGAACIQAAIDAGDDETGVTAIHVTKQLDAGDMICWKSIPIRMDETGGVLHDRLADLAPEVLRDALGMIEAGEGRGMPQDASISTYVSKLEREDGRIDWGMDAAALERRIRAYEPWPGTFTEASEDGKWKRMKIFPPVEICGDDLEAGEVLCSEAGEMRVGCGSGSLRLTTVQPEGSRRMDAADYLRGRKPEQMR